jgi:hypothetical protein
VLLLKNKNQEALEADFFEECSGRSLVLEGNSEHLSTAIPNKLIAYDLLNWPVTAFDKHIG